MSSSSEYISTALNLYGEGPSLPGVLRGQMEIHGVVTSAMNVFTCRAIRYTSERHFLRTVSQALGPILRYDRCLARSSHSSERRCSNKAVSPNPLDRYSGMIAGMHQYITARVVTEPSVHAMSLYLRTLPYTILQLLVL
jgi:hypothetical protein